MNVNVNELYNNNKRFIYPSYNNMNKNNNNLKNVLYKHKYIMNPINYIKPPLLISDDKSNNVNKEIKLRALKPNLNNTNKIVIVANNSNNLNSSTKT